MKKTLKYFLPILCMIAALAALTLAAAAATETGSCGTDLTYTFDTETGVLTISGKGAMGDYTFTNNSGEMHPCALEQLCGRCAHRRAGRRRDHARQFCAAKLQQPGEPVSADNPDEDRSRQPAVRKPAGKLRDERRNLRGRLADGL